VGTNAVRYPHQFTLTLKGLASEANPGGMGSKFLGAMNGGTIHLHGPERVSWTKLGATALAGATTLTLDDPVDWVAGEQMVITSTYTNWNHAEERVIASVSGDGLTVILTEALEYTHTGVTETHIRPTDNKTWSIELKAEVGLLSRDVKVQGDVFSDVDGFGGHTMAMDSPTTAPAAFYAEGVEILSHGANRRDWALSGALALVDGSGAGTVCAQQQYPPLLQSRRDDSWHGLHHREG
jgi:hypothetical protein